MPYKTIADLPEAVRTALPEDAQRRFMAVANAYLIDKKPESQAIASAWTVVRNGWEKGEDGKWRRRDDLQKSIIAERVMSLHAALDVAVSKGFGKAGSWFANRWPAGSAKGGQFAPKGGTGVSAPQLGLGGGYKAPSDQYAPQPYTKPAPPAGAKPHPKKDDNGKSVTVDYPTRASHNSTWKDPNKTATFVPGGQTPDRLNGVEMKPWAAPTTTEGWKKVAGTNPSLDDIPFDAHPTKKTGAGVLVVEPDGRVWLTRPTNSFGGYVNTFPKGTAEKELSLQQNAIKEAFEETGLRVKITGVLGDYERDTSVARMFIARRVGGTPKDMGWESQAVRLATLKDAMELLNKPHDKGIMQDLSDELSLSAPTPKPKTIKKSSWEKQPRWPAGSPLGGQWQTFGADGLPVPPKLGSAANPGYQKAVDALHAKAQAGDVKAIQDVVTGKKAALDKFDAQKAAGSTVNSTTKWAAGIPYYGQALLDAMSAKTTATASADAMSGPEKLTNWDYAAPKPGGSNPGAIYTDGKGEKWLVKGSNAAGLGSAEATKRAQNEVLASKLMQATGVGVPDMKLVNLEGQHGGGFGVASKWQEGMAKFTGTAAQLAATQKDFAVHAWLGNYDVIGLSKDNTVFDKDGKAVNIDPGGALLYRAQGAAKGDAFGNKVVELNSLRKKVAGIPDNPNAHAVYGKMTMSQIQESTQKLALINDETIKKLCMTYGPGTPSERMALAEKLIARKSDMIAQVGEMSAARAKASATAAAAAQATQAAATTRNPMAAAGTKIVSDAVASGIKMPNIKDSTKGASAFYQKQTAEALLHHKNGNIAAIQEMKDKTKVNSYNGKEMHAMYDSMLADLKTKVAAGAAKALEPVKDVPKTGDAIGTKAAMPSNEKYKMDPNAPGKSAATLKDTVTHNAKLDSLALHAAKGDVKALLAQNYASNHYGQKQAKFANDALAALGSDQKVVAGQKANTHPALQAAGITPAAPAGVQAGATAKPVAAPAAAGDAGWVKLRAGEKIVEQGESFGVKWAKVEVPAKGFDPSSIAQPPDFFSNGSQGPNGKWKSSKEHINNANNAAGKAILDSALKDKSAAALDKLQVPVIDKETGAPTGKMILVKDHPAAEVKEYFTQIKSELEAQTKPTFKSKQSGSFSGAYSDIAAAVSKAHQTVDYANFKAHADKAADYLVLSKDAVSSVPVPQQGFFELKPGMKAYDSWKKESVQNFDKMTAAEKNALKAYTGASYSTWNQALRTGDTASSGFSSAKPLIEAFKKAAVDLPEGATLWRGLGVGAATYKSVEGGVIQDGSFQSASYGASPGFSSYGTWLRIRAGKGVKAVAASAVSSYSSEREIVIQNNVRYMVLKVETHDNFVDSTGKNWGKKTIVDVIALPHP
jgi:cation transport regulator ChaB/ADP-ribose pyrophosphatase YjhB (NUDIX family)